MLGYELQCINESMRYSYDKSCEKRSLGELPLVIAVTMQLTMRQPSGAESQQALRNEQESIKLTLLPPVFISQPHHYTHS